MAFHLGVCNVNCYSNDNRSCLSICFTVSNFCTTDYHASLILCNPHRFDWSGYSLTCVFWNSVGWNVLIDYALTRWMKPVYWSSTHDQSCYYYSFVLNTERKPWSDQSSFTIGNYSLCWFVYFSYATWFQVAKCTMNYAIFGGNYCHFRIKNLLSLSLPLNHRMINDKY